MSGSCRTLLAALGERVRGLRTWWVLVWVLVLGLYYGMCMGAYGLFLGGSSSAERGERVVSAMVKVPLLLLILWGVGGGMLTGVHRLGKGAGFGGRAVMRWTGESMLVLGLILGVLSPVVVVPELLHNYAACVLLNYGVFSVAGSGAVVWFAQRVETTAIGRRASRAMAVAAFVCFAVIGGGAGWSLRPFIGYSGQSFTWFRAEHSSVLEQIYYEWHNLWHY